LLTADLPPSAADVLAVQQPSSTPGLRPASARFAAGYATDSDTSTSLLDPASPIHSPANGVRPVTQPTEHSAGLHPASRLNNGGVRAEALVDSPAVAVEVVSDAVSDRYSAGGAVLSPDEERGDISCSAHDMTPVAANVLLAEGYAADSEASIKTRDSHDAASAEQDLSPALASVAVSETAGFTVSDAVPARLPLVPAGDLSHPLEWTTSSVSAAIVSQTQSTAGYEGVLSPMEPPVEELSGASAKSRVVESLGDGVDAEVKRESHKMSSQVPASDIAAHGTQAYEGEREQSSVIIADAGDAGDTSGGIGSGGMFQGLEMA